MLFLNSAIKKDTQQTLLAQPDFVIHKHIGGQSVPIESNRIQLLSKIRGITQITPRIYGRYFLPDHKHYFTIVGIDLFETHNEKTLQQLIDDIDIKKFLAKEHMIIGKGVRKYLTQNYYKDYFNFQLSTGTQKKVTIYDQFDPQVNLLSNDLVLTTVELAQEILGLTEDQATDIAIYVRNEAEQENVKFKLLSSHFDTKIISKDEINTAYETFFNYKGGLFLILYIIIFLTFMLILYQRYSMINSSDKKEIAILRSVGWSIKDILQLKVLETVIVGLFAFVFGILIAYVFVFIFDAPLLSHIFLGFNNLHNSVVFTPVFDLGLISSLFLFFIISFIASVLIPVWKIAITDPNEAMK